MENEGPISINLHEILRNRITGWKGRMIPGCLITALEKLIRQKELNEILEHAYPNEGSEFCREVYEFLNISLSVDGFQNVPEKGRFIFASNHPLGGLDGMGLIFFLGNEYGDEHIRFLVNDMLMNIVPLRNVFLPINKYGSQGREAARLINEAYASDDTQIIIFPAGLVSRLQDSGKIEDLEWQKAFVSKAIEYKRDIIPVHFEGQNSMTFYKTARLRKKLGLKINLEQALLPSEVMKSRNTLFRIRFGMPIPWDVLKYFIEEKGQTPKDLANQIRDIVYG